MTAGAAITDEPLLTAVDWRVRLDSGAATDVDRRAHAEWLDADPAHRVAWERVGGVAERPLAALRGAGSRHPAHRAAALQVLGRGPRKPQRRRIVGTGAAVLLGAGAGALVLDRQAPLLHRRADLHTATAQRFGTRLADGSDLLLDARSAVDLRFDDGQRLLRLRAGRLAVRVARDGRPFIVETAQGRVQALGTRFTVAQLDGHSEVTVLEHSVRVTVTGGLDRVLATGEGAVFDGDRIELRRRDARARSAWTEGLLDVRDEPLAAVIDALRPYLHGLVRISPEAGKLRVFGVFPLDRPEQVLQDLVDTQPIRVRRWGRWVTLIDQS